LRAEQGFIRHHAPAVFLHLCRNRSVSPSRPSPETAYCSLMEVAFNCFSGMIAALSDSRMLLLLDNCEHVIDAAANLAAAIRSGAPGVDILATSREPLRVAGEREYRLGPLSSPKRLTSIGAHFPSAGAVVAGVSGPGGAFTRSACSSRVQLCRDRRDMPALEARTG
jgi:predicted ATPase